MRAALKVINFFLFHHPVSPLVVIPLFIVGFVAAVWLYRRYF
jgi:hypothetical protein